MFFAAKKQTKPNQEMALKANAQTKLHNSETNQWFQQTAQEVKYIKISYLCQHED